MIPADRRPPEKEETWILATDQHDPCAFPDGITDLKAKGSQDSLKTQSRPPPTETISTDAGDNVDNILPRSQETRKSKTKKVKSYLRKCKGALSKGDESTTEKKRQENCTSWYLEDLPVSASHQEENLSEKYMGFPEEVLEVTGDVDSPVEDSVPEIVEETFSRDENLQETPDGALNRLLEEDRRIDLSKSEIYLYEDVKDTNPEQCTFDFCKRQTEGFCKEKKDTVSPEALTTENTNLNEYESNDTLIAEVTETTETGTVYFRPELTIAVEEEDNVTEECEEKTLLSPTFCRVSVFTFL